MINPNNIKLFDLLHNNKVICSKSEFKRHSCTNNVLVNDSPIELENYNTTIVKYSDIISFAYKKYCYTPIGLITATGTIDEHTNVTKPTHIEFHNLFLVYDLLKMNDLVVTSNEFKLLTDLDKVKINDIDIHKYTKSLNIEDKITFKDKYYLIMTSGQLIEKIKDDEEKMTAIAQITNILFDLFINNELVDTPSQLIELLKQSKVNNIPMKFYNTPVTVNDTITINNEEFTLKYKLVDKKPKDAKVTCVPPNEVLIEQNVGKIKK